MPSSTHWQRTDGVELFLRSHSGGDSLTVVHNGRDLTDGDVADALRLLGLTVSDVLCTHARSPDQREFSCPPVIGPIVHVLAAARPARVPNSPRRRA